MSLDKRKWVRAVRRAIFLARLMGYVRLCFNRYAFSVFSVYGDLPVQLYQSS